MAAFGRPASRTKLPGLYLAGGSVHPGAGVPMAATSGRLAAASLLADLDFDQPRFDQPVAPRGYAWWYVDALSDDGRHGVTLIAFIGNVFSPYYAWARRRDARAGRGTDPANHCALNVALYGATKRWSLTERGRNSLRRDATRLEIGSSALAWDGVTLTVSIDEITAPIPSRLRGVVRVTPTPLFGRVFTLDAPGLHRWSPLGPRSHVEVEMEKPGLRWSGAGYFDTNDGDGPLEESFSVWDWSRAPLADGGTGVLYDVTRRDGSNQTLAVRYDPAGSVEDVPVPPRVTLPKTAIWRIARDTHTDAPGGARVTKTLEDTPFYARSVLATELLGEPVTAMHESLSLDRFSAPWVQAMLPFRMPRITW